MYEEVYIQIHYCIGDNSDVNFKDLIYNYT